MYLPDKEIINKTEEEIMDRTLKHTSAIAIACMLFFAMVVSLAAVDVQAAQKKPVIAEKATTVLNGKEKLKIKKNGYKITKVVSVKSAKKAVAKADASKSKVTVYGITRLPSLYHEISDVLIQASINFN
jgi:hypothetical protein